MDCEKQNFKNSIFNEIFLKKIKKSNGNPIGSHRQREREMKNLVDLGKYWKRSNSKKTTPLDRFGFIEGKLLNFEKTRFSNVTRLQITLV